MEHAHLSLKHHILLILYKVPTYHIEENFDFFGIFCVHTYKGIPAKI